jgi:glycerol uptake facilitator-like aquaporin
MKKEPRRGRRGSVPAFIVAQLVGTLAALAVAAWLFPKNAEQI